MRHRRMNWKWKAIGIAAAVLLMTAGTTMTTYASDGEWKNDDTGWWYVEADGTIPKNQWLEIDGKWYWCEDDGYVATGWRQKNEKWYYFDKSGVMATGFQTITNDEGITRSYCFSEDGEMLTGWQKIDDTKWGYFYPKGDTVGALYENNTYEAGSIKGIDVSKYQKEIDWKAVKDYGISFAFIRVGSVVKGERTLDPYFQANMKGAYEAGIPAGVYYYSTAMSLEESIDDAQFVIDQMQGYHVSYPVVIDLEDKCQSEGLTKQQITEIGKVFCDEIRKAGYTPMVYCNENWYTNYVDVSAMGDVEVWIARYNGVYDTEIPRDIWQSSSTARVDGVDGAVDINFGFTDYTQILTPRTAYADTYEKTKGVWRQDSNGYWYSYIAGGYPKNQWELIDGIWYWFNAEGYESPITGWQYLGENWYYYDADGTPAEGWRESNGKWYYMDEDGKMTTGWQKADGKWYYMNEDGVMQSNGWLELNGSWYYLSGSGDAATGWLLKNGKWYYMDDEGKMVTGWRSVNDKWYYFGNAGDGSMKSGWQEINHKWYYLGSSNDGSMKTGWQKISGSWYYFDETGDGKMLSGWQYIDNKWYYLGSEGDGAMKTGWQKVNGTWYYMYSDGSMASSTWINGYYVDGSGAWR